MNSGRSSKLNTLFLSYLAIGGILGDIGTSPLYVISLTFKTIPITRENVQGVLSLIFWSFMFLSLKYAGLALTLDNQGEGGTFTLLHLIQEEVRRLKEKFTKSKFTLFLSCATILSMICGALLLSDGVITPSISVLAAIEGVEVFYPHLAEFVLPTAAIILSALFFFQKKGTEKIAKLFSPIIIIWFLSIALVGIKNLLLKPSLVKSLSPYYAYKFLTSHPFSLIFPVLGYIVLCITGGEALYADQAHYSKPAIRLAWFVAAICLLLNYLGQGAFILTYYKCNNPFFDMSISLGHYFYLYLLFLATLAAIIASQAMITGSFSTYKQAMELRMLPRVEIKNTSYKTKGQIYIPTVNKAMFVACLATVFVFKSSDALGDAYGLAVTGAFIGTTLMMAMVFFLRSYPNQMKKFFSMLPLLIFFLIFDAAFFFSNLGKIPTGGWFPLLIATFLVFTMIAWQKGSFLLYQYIPKTSLEHFIEQLTELKPVSLQGTNIYLTLNTQEIPGCLLEEVKQGWIKKIVLIVTVKNTHSPWGIHYEKILLVNNEYTKIYRIIIYKGYMRLFVNIPNIISSLEFEQKPRTFIFSLWNPVITEKSWKKWLLFYFKIIYKNVPTLTRRFSIPSSELLYLGKDIEIFFPKN
ncbi:MAG: KUP/HAK/KT family potassium transporter [Desulfonauticus sp.]|nr:KUP/HAK/KT family potassium transporter [Desulfonauticus sp.]